jgi:hypothetical protein
MKVRILSAAEEDLEEGFRFYESQLLGLGSYFLDSLYSDIDSLAYFGGIHKESLSGIAILIRTKPSSSWMEG